MKNIQTIFLRFASLTLLLQIPITITNPFLEKYISPQTGKRICQIATLYSSYITAGSFSLDPNEIKSLSTRFSIIWKTIILSTLPAVNVCLSISEKQNLFKINNINYYSLVGTVALAGSLAGWHYFNKQIEAKKQSSNISSMQPKLSDIK